MKVFKKPDCTVCGRIPISITLETVKQRGAKKVVVLYQTNSGDVINDRHPGSYTVGYLAAAFIT
jgi:AmmeMemoRadiSam system protein B